MAEEVSVSKFEYNDDDIDDVVNGDDDEDFQDDNDNNLSQENLEEKSHEDPNVSCQMLIKDGESFKLI